MTDSLASRTGHASGVLRSAPVLAVLGFGALLGVLGPFGSYLGMALPIRILHYTACMAVISAMAVAANALAARFVFRGSVPLWAALAIALALAVPGAGVVWSLLSLWAPQVLPYVSFAELCLQAALINVVVSLFVRLIRAWMTGRSAAPPPGAASAASGSAEAVAASAPDFSALREKLPLPLRRGRILALSAEDHYLRVHTDRGDALVLMSLSAAMATLGAAAGIQVHRSHWIAQEALVAGTARIGRAGIVLDGGPALPVSRAGRRRLAEEGVA